MLGLVLAALALPAIAAGEPIASAVGVKPSATGQLDGLKVTLKAADDLFEGQTITTTGNGQVQIVFADETHMVVGPGSTLVIQKILMRNNGTASNFAVSALGGTFRFISGKSNKNAYKISTPAGTIGVRGTKFDFSVDPDKKDLNVVLFEGSVDVCLASGGCESVEQRCDVGTSQGSSTQIISSGNNGYNSATSDLPYIKSQSGLQSDFRVSGATSCGQQEQQQQESQPTADPGPAKPDAKPDPIPDPLPDNTGN